MAVEKLIKMKQQTSHYEILLFTGTGFSRREFSSREENSKKLSGIEELEKACWAGMLSEILPEVMPEEGSGKGIYIWNILNGKNYLYITIGPYQMVTDNETTIDPYFFLSATCEN